MNYSLHSYQWELYERRVLGVMSCTYGRGAGTLPAQINAEVYVTVFPTHYVAGTVQMINCVVSWFNVLGDILNQNPIQDECTK